MSARTAKPAVSRATRGEAARRSCGSQTTGRVSGEPRTTPLIFRPDGDSWVVVASKGGSPDHPGWYQNLEARADATIQVKDEQIPVRARTAEGDERARLWE